MTRANKLLSVIGEADDPNSLFAADDSVVDDETSIKDDESDEPLDLGAEDDTLAPDDDEFDLGGSASTPSVRIEKDGPITVNKGDIQLTIGDDGGIDISLDGDDASLSDDGLTDDLENDSLGDEEGEEKKEDDEYQIDWEKEAEDNPADDQPKEGFSKARLILGLKESVIYECTDKVYECNSCDGYDCCKDKHKQKYSDEEDSDFLSKGYL